MFSCTGTRKESKRRRSISFKINYYGTEFRFTRSVNPGFSMETSMTTDNAQTPAFQDYYPDDYAHCFGCGRLNRKGAPDQELLGWQGIRLPRKTSFVLFRRDEGHPLSPYQKTDCLQVLLLYTVKLRIDRGIVRPSQSLHGPASHK